MKITRVSPLSGTVRVRDLDITQEQLDAWRQGALIETVMPLLSPDDREFVQTGITPEEWDEAFGEAEAPDDDDDDDDDAADINGADFIDWLATHHRDEWLKLRSLFLHGAL
jgi:hypothetical protein